MRGKSNSRPYRRKKAHISQLGTTQLHLRSPLIIASWSLLFPGLSHMLLSKYVRGFLLFLWELYVNYQANINMAIYYSFTGNISAAKEVLDINWMLLYVPTYIFAFWDGYRTTVDLNKEYKLATREDYHINEMVIKTMEVNYLDKRKPWVPVAWSILMPGAGQLYTHRIISAFFIVIWWIAVIYFSRTLPAIHLSFLGRFKEASAVIDTHWYMNIPSIYLFALYESYTGVVENNKLFDWELSKFLKQHYQNNRFNMPDKEKRGDKLYIISTFDYNSYLEMALTSIQMKGIPKEKILAAPVDVKGEKGKPIDTIHSSDGLSYLDLACILGAVFMLVGSIYGFVLAWGPIWWGIIGLLAGLALGFIIKLFLNKKYTLYRRKNKKSAEVVVIIECEKEQVEMIKNTLWDNNALGVSKLDLFNENMIK